MKIELGSIENKQTQENFKEIKAEFDKNPVLKADFKFYDRTYTQAGVYDLPHGLRYKPKDILITLNTCGASINNATFTKDVISISVTGPGELRFLLGRITA